MLVCDIENFAALTDSLGAHRTIEFLNAYFEVVVASVKPETLLAGKVLGLGALGLVQTAVWLVASRLLL